jgi:hypothetical protein
MSSVIISGDTSGAVTVSAPLVAGTNTLTLQAATATNSVNTLATAVASTSGTSIDFTGIPSWVKRITVMFSGFSTNGSSKPRIQLGDSGGVETTGYAGSNSAIGSSTANSAGSTGGFDFNTVQTTAAILGGSAVFSLLNASTNTWVCNAALMDTVGYSSLTGGSKSLSDTLTQVRITTVNGTDTFDAGSVNILYEG